MIDYPAYTAAEHDHAASAKLGMWLFIFTEIILFGTMFIVYAVYLHQRTYEFRDGSAMLDKPIGAINTMILITSSLTMALSISVLQQSSEGRGKRRCLCLLAFTVLLALAFLGIKGFEWYVKFQHHIYPNSPLFDTWPGGKVAFFGLYYLMTGLHALHVAVGVLVIAIAGRLVIKGRIRSDQIAFLENTGLYWHLVDVIWIFLFPLFYLIG